MDITFENLRSDIIVKYSRYRSDDIKKLWFNKDFCDVSIQLKNSIFPCYKFVLSESNIFKVMFSRWTNNENIIYLQNENFSDDIMILFFKSLFGYKIEIDILWLLILANKFCVKEIENDARKILLNKIKNNHTTINITNILTVDDMLMCNLTDPILDIFEQNIQNYIDDKTLHLLDDNILLYLSQSDNLVINDEYELYAAICEFDKDKEFMHKLLDNIRFKNISRYLLKYICERACYSEYLQNKINEAYYYHTFHKCDEFDNPRKYKLVETCEWIVRFDGNISIRTRITKKFGKITLSLHPRGDNENGRQNNLHLYVRPQENNNYLKWYGYILNQFKNNKHTTVTTSFDFRKRTNTCGYGHYDIMSSDDYFNPANGWIVNNESIIIVRIFEL